MGVPWTRKLIWRIIHLLVVVEEGWNQSCAIRRFSLSLFFLLMLENVEEESLLLPPLACPSSFSLSKVDTFQQKRQSCQNSYPPPEVVPSRLFKKK